MRYLLCLMTHLKSNLTYLAHANSFSLNPVGFRIKDDICTSAALHNKPCFACPAANVVPPCKHAEISMQNKVEMLRLKVQQAKCKNADKNNGRDSIATVCL